MAFFASRRGVRTRGGGRGMGIYGNFRPVYERSDCNMFSCLAGDDGQDGDNENSASSDSEDLLADKFSSTYQEVRYKKKRKLNTSSGDRSKLEPQESEDEVIDYGSLSKDEKLDLILSKMCVNEKRLKHYEQMLDGALKQKSRVDKVESVVRSYEDRIKLLEYKSIDLEARSRRNNLLFYQLAEVRNENCNGIVTQFLLDKFNIEIDESAICRAHRLGRFKGKDKPRPIIVAFQEYILTERIVRQAHILKETKFGVSRDHPIEITRARKTLWPDFKQVKALNPSAKVAISYPAKLMVNGRVVKDLFPEWDLVI